MTLPPWILELDSLDATRRFASLLVPHLYAGLRIGLSGELGAGKTELVRQLAGELGGSREMVSSPTYVLEAVYEIEPQRARNAGVCCIRHWDLYRLAPGAGPEELFDMRGFARAITLVEWPERASDWESEEDLRITFSIPEGRRAPSGGAGELRRVELVTRSQELSRGLRATFDKGFK